eukprot:m.220781 g.220781  ORF g.220781 m.220781 type:complete len:260 (+) comp39949_c0_seq7:625-1404(+)
MNFFGVCPCFGVEHTEWECLGQMASGIKLLVLFLSLIYLTWLQTKGMHLLIARQMISQRILSVSLCLLWLPTPSDPLQRHNSRLLMDYGFVLENNPHDCVTIGKPTPDDEDADKDIRSTVLSWVPALQTPYIQLYRLNQTELLKSPLMTAMRILVMPKNSLEDLYKMKHEKKQQINKIGSLPPPDEIKVLQKAIGYIETHLSRYPVEDTEAFGAKAAFPTQLRKRMVTLRKEEKQMLLSILRELQLQAQRVVRLLSGEL